ncbi:spore coat protein CotH [Paenibacillus sp. 79R4]|uniref:CotH kinase family protein n=1 Tax=Paenibacillus sp. 79R4 TaxID=2212847 RepID=UPI0015BBCB18|nr:CotH kinase family protein [Paenibacillus sp. 79R4]NWL89363.1 spore coat protein CotH [Paenibacillus sp. 79R4]
MKTKFSRFLLCLCSFILIFAMTACDTNSSPTISNDTEKTGNTSSPVTDRLDEEVFPKDKVVDVKITIDEDDFQDMLDHASDEEMKTASVDYNGKHFDNIGIRTKGNLTLRSVVQMEDSDRYSFKLSFDEYINQTLDGISKINLNNNYSDASYMREFLAYELAEQMGLPTPKYSYVNVYINDELWGFYLAVEQIGDAYLERHFGNSYGALYKGEMTGSGSELSWLGDDPNSYTGLVQKSKTANGNILIDMLNELNNGSDYEKYIDVTEALKYIALNVATNNSDSYIGANKQNYYLYEDEGVFSILPWDYNMAFGGMGGGMGGGMNIDMGGFKRNTDADAPDADTPANIPDGDVPGGDLPNNPDADIENNADAAKGNNTGNGKLLIDEPTQGAVAERPLIAKLIAVDKYKEEYHEILKEATEGYLANDAFTARVNQLSEMISSYVKADPTAFYTYEQYEQALPQLINSNSSQVENITQQLDGTIPSSGDGSGSGGGMGGGMGGRGGMGGGRPTMGQGGNVQGEQAQPIAPNGDVNAAPTPSEETNKQARQKQGTDGSPTQQTTNSEPQQSADHGQQSQTDQVQPDETNAPTDLPAWNGERGQAGIEGGFPGGFGERGGFGQGTAQTDGSSGEAITAGISLVILALGCIFVARFHRRR